MDNEKSIEYYGVNSFEENNPIRIFRKINLTVCMNEKVEIFSDIPTYEIIGQQKHKDGKKTFYFTNISALVL